jgi:uncharacterized protein
MAGPALSVMSGPALSVMAGLVPAIRALQAYPHSAMLFRMDRGEAMARLKQHEAELKRLGIEHLHLFGSTARDEARPDSDVDLFFDHPEGSIGLCELMDVKQAAARILGYRADIMTRRSLHRVLRQRIESSALQVF